MSTRSAIIIRTKAGFSGIYCHNNGEPEYVGKTLREHYLDPQKVRELIALGDISSLGERVHPIGPHSFDNREPDTTVAYGRDRGESNVEATHTSTALEMLEIFRDRDAEYAYIFGGLGWTTNKL